MTSITLNALVDSFLPQSEIIMGLKGLIEVWHDFKQSVIDDAIDELYKRLRACISVKVILLVILLSVCFVFLCFIVCYSVFRPQGCNKLDLN